MPAENIELDIRGQVCPSCLLLALREINRQHAALMNRRARLTVMIHSRDATTTIPEAIKNMGLRVNVEKQHGSYRVVIEGPEEQA